MITGEYIGGFRIVRTLGVGSRAEVYLGHGGAERVAAIKVFGPTATLDSIDTEIEALQRADHAHSLQLRDVASAPGGLPCLVLERLGHGSLARLLSGRAALAPGEAVTILAPLIAAIGALHSSGVAHGRISADTVLFRESGAPVLAGFGHAQLLPPATSPALLAASRVVLEDRLALGRLSATVLSRVGGNGALDLARWLSELERDGFPDGFARDLEARVFALGLPVAVRLVPDAEDSSSRGLPLRLHTAEPVETSLTVAARPAPSPSLSSRTLSRLSLGSVTELVLPRLRALRLPDIRGIRRPVWVAAGVGVAALVVALLVVPDGGDGVAAPAPVSTPVGPASAGDSTIGGDDPVAALAELLAGRAQCVSDLSILCLENVVQSGSAAMDDDVALIHGIEDGSVSGSLAGEASGIVLLERHGDAALLGYQTGVNDQPASALLVKGEAGWRIRDYVAAN